MQVEDRATAGALEEEREDPVQHAGETGDDHAAADAGGEGAMLAVGLADRRRMAGELLQEGHGSVRLAGERSNELYDGRRRETLLFRADSRLRRDFSPHNGQISSIFC